MRRLRGWGRKLSAATREELRLLMTIQSSDRAWQMPFAASLAAGLPLLVGAYFNHLDYGLASSLGGLVFLYLPSTPLSHRMVALMACSFGMSACYTLGVMSQFVPTLMMPVLAFTSILVTMVCRFYAVAPPGSLFFIMAAAIGAYSPVEELKLPLMVGLITMGTVLACLIGFLYSLYMLRRHAPNPVMQWPAPTFNFVVLESVVIGAFVGISLILAQVLQLEKAYWVPVSCLVVIQNTSLRAVWTKQLHRLMGTAMGLFVAWGLLLLPLDKWSVSLTMMVLVFIVESMIVRHYAVAAAFITPVTILLAEAANLGQGSPTTIIQARLFDTLLGCIVGLIGGICLHNATFREVVGSQIRHLISPRFIREFTTRTDEKISVVRE